MSGQRGKRAFRGTRHGKFLRAMREKQMGKTADRTVRPAQCARPQPGSRQQPEQPRKKRKRQAARTAPAVHPVTSEPLPRKPTLRISSDCDQRNFATVPANQLVDATDGLQIAGRRRQMLRYLLQKICRSGFSEFHIFRTAFRTRRAFVHGALRIMHGIPDGREQTCKE